MNLDLNSTAYLPNERNFKKNNIKKYSGKFKIAVVNVRSLTASSALYELIHEAKTSKLGILGIIEHRRILKEPWTQPMPLGAGWQWIISSAEKGTDGKHGSIGGVGLLISPQWSHAYISNQSISPRVMVVSFQGKHNKFHVIIFYSPTATMRASKLAVRAEYNLILEFIRSQPKGDIIVTLCDANATLSTDDDTCTPRRVLFSPKEKSNKNSEIFRDFLDESNNFPVNARFRQRHRSLYYSFFGPKKRRARLDYILIHGKWLTCISDAYVQPLKFISSDHSMVIAEGKWRLKVKEKIQAKPRLDFSVLKQADTARHFLESMTTHYHFDADSSVDTNFGSMVDAFNSACQETDLPVQTREQKRIPW
jgi:exonuclease III